MKQAAEEVRGQVLAYLERRPDLTAADLSAHTKLAQSTCRHFMDGRNLITGQDGTAAEFARVLRLAEMGDILPAGASPVAITEAHPEAVARLRKAKDYYQIETVHCVATTLTYCAENALIGVVTGDYGIGKTEAVKAWRRGPGRKLASLVYEFNEFTAKNIVSFVQAIASLLDVPITLGSNNGGRVFEAVVEALIDAPCLLILDQCETVSPRVMQIVRQIHDRTRDAGVGIALLASPVLMERLKGARIRDLGALSSRVGVWTQLRGLSAAEMGSILKAEGISRVDDDAFRMWHRAVGGSMRRLMSSVTLIQSKHAGKAITERTVAGVAASLWGMTLGVRAVGAVA